MSDLYLDKLLETANSEQIGKNADSFSSMFDEALKVMNKIDSILEVLDKRGLVEIGKRYAIKKYELQNVPDLKPDKAGVIPNSETHKTAFEQLNNVPEHELKERLERQKALMKASADNDLSKPE